MSLLVGFDEMLGVRLPEGLGRLSSAAIPGSVVSGSVGIDRRSGFSRSPGRSLQSPSQSALPPGGVGLLATVSIGLLMMVGLVALVRLVVGEELFEAQRRRGHGG